MNRGRAGRRKHGRKGKSKYEMESEKVKILADSPKIEATMICWQEKLVCCARGEKFRVWGIWFSY